MGLQVLVEALAAAVVRLLALAALNELPLELTVQDTTLLAPRGVEPVPVEMLAVIELANQILL